MSRLQRKFVFSVLVLLIGWRLFVYAPEISRPPGVLVHKTPIQTDMPSSAKAILFKGDVLQPLASFDIEARVLSKEKYRRDWSAKYSNWDFTLGWNNMSDTSVLKQLSIRQNLRFYWVTWNNPPPIAEDEIFESSSNMHLIAKNKYIAGLLDDVIRGQVIRLRGYLVRVDSRDGGEWKSSLTRSDRGDGACEVVYVESVETLL